MDVTDAELLEVADVSQIGEARRRIALIATEHGLEQRTIDRLAVVCSELTTNLVKHAKGGSMIAQCLSDGSNIGIELFALDKGRGMSNIEDCFRDGFSTTGTLGTGLGAITRMSDSVSVSSSQSRGTVIQARLWSYKTASVDEGIGGLTVPLKGELLSGDKWIACKIQDGFYCLVVDGLGHGFEAAEAARLAVKRFKENLSLNPASMIDVLHRALRGTRGAAGAVARINFKQHELEYAGLGNITGLLVTNSDFKHLTSLNGTLGYEARKITAFTLPWSAQSVLVMHSDGLSSRVSEDTALSDNQSNSASIIAASLYLHQSKAIDDATVMVVKQPG